MDQVKEIGLIIADVINMFRLDGCATV